MNVQMDEHGNPKPTNPPSAAGINSSTIDVNTLHNGGVNVAKAMKKRKSKKRRKQRKRLKEFTMLAKIADSGLFKKNLTSLELLAKK